MVAAAAAARSLVENGSGSKGAAAEKEEMLVNCETGTTESHADCSGWGGDAWGATTEEGDRPGSESAAMEESSSFGASVGMGRLSLRWRVITWQAIM